MASSAALPHDVVAATPCIHLIMISVALSRVIPTKHQKMSGVCTYVFWVSGLERTCRTKRNCKHAPQDPGHDCPTLVSRYSNTHAVLQCIHSNACVVSRRQDSIARTARAMHAVLPDQQDTSRVPTTRRSACCGRYDVVVKYHNCHTCATFACFQTPYVNASPSHDCMQHLWQSPFWHPEWSRPCVARRKQHRPGIAPNANTTHVPTAESSAAPTKANHAPSRHPRAKGKLLLQMVTPHAARSRRTHVSRTQECALTAVGCADKEPESQSHPGSKTTTRAAVTTSTCMNSSPRKLSQHTVQ